MGDLQVEKGTCMGLLGHNGAGKTTSLNMLIGLLAPTYGDITVNGISVRENLEAVRRQLGVCPQHDILWGELTPWQHLRLFARLRGLPKEYILGEIINRLKAVNLYDVRDRPVKTFSGGMKRRLTVAISLIGSPPVVLLDEPTTGLDPKSRTNVWELIQSMKGHCVIILTTHSMAEADALSDRIAIMADGKLRCVGNSLELKAKYGAGYNLTMVSNEGRKRTQGICVRIPSRSCFVQRRCWFHHLQCPSKVPQEDWFIFEGCGKCHQGKHQDAQQEGRCCWCSCSTRW